MTLRGPAAHRRRTPTWRRSGDDSYWERLIAEEEVVPRVSRTPRVPRPQSAIEGGQMDDWLQQLQSIQSGHLRAPVHGQVPPFNDRTASVSALNKEPTGPTLRRQGIPSFYSRDFSSSGSPSLCESTLGSQESLQVGLSTAPERKGGREKVHIMQAPRTEQAKLSSLAPVKMGWLPIQRKVRVTDAQSQNQYLDHSASQVKLKQPITPTYKKNPAKANGFRHLDGEVENSHTSPSALAVRTWPAPDQGSPTVEQEPEKLSSAPKEGDRPLSWQSLRRGWTINRVLPLSGGSQSNDILTRASSDTPRKTPLVKTTSLQPYKHTTINNTTSVDTYNPYTPQQSTNSVDTYNSYTPLQRTNSVETYNPYTPLQKTTNVQPKRSTVPLNTTNSLSQPSHIETSSAVTTLIPQNQAGFSSITISSKKVTRSASLSVPNIPTSSHSAENSENRAPPSLPQAHHSMDPKHNLVTLQRKATIVKVTEHRMTSSPSSYVKGTESPPYNPPSNHPSDTVVHRRKATIIKVTEHRESYSPAKAGSRTRHPEYRHSYTEGVWRENSMWHQGALDPSEYSSAPSYHQLGSPERTTYAQTPNTSSSVVLKDPEESGGRALHRSMLSLFVSNPPAIAAPPPTDLSSKADGKKLGRPRRPLSCYGNVFGHTELREENVTQPTATRKWSFELPQETNVNPMNSDSSYISHRTVLKEAGQPVEESLKPNEDGKERFPPPQEEERRRSSPSLTLIKAPDPHSQQSPEEILALNAAAIIANIKLQRQLSKKKTQNGDSEKDSMASPQGNIVSDVGKREKPHSDQNPVQHGANTTHHNLPHAEFVPLSADSERSAKTISLQEALEKSRPDFISRSQDRVRELERRAQERRKLADSTDPQSDATLRQKRGQSSRPTSLSDNLFKPRDRAITGKEMQLRSKRTPPEVKRKKEEEKKREVCLTNRQRVELFRKKLLDQLLQRGHD